MRTSRMIQLNVCLVAFAFLTGCATAPKGPKDEDLIKKAMNDWSAALVAKDIDKVMTYYSDAYSSSEYGNKEGMRNFLKNEALPMHYLDDIKVDLQNLKIDVKKDTAEAGPINLIGNFGNLTMKATLKKEKAGWRVIATDQA